MKVPVSILAHVALVGSAFAADFQREMSTDRPDTTESPISVEQGAWQIESSLWSFSRDKVDGVKTDVFGLAEANIKYGITENQDIQLVVRPWVRETIRTAGAPTQTNEGFGDIDVRYKFNLWGNDGGKTAFGLMPFVTIPTQTAVSGGEWEGGLIVPFAVELSDRVGLGLMGEIDRVWDGADHEWEFMHTAVLGIDLGHGFGLYLEYIGVSAPKDYLATASGGITFASSENVQWDMGLTIGINDAAEDFGCFQGVSFKF